MSTADKPDGVGLTLELEPAAARNRRNDMAWGDGGWLKPGFGVLLLVLATAGCEAEVTAPVGFHSAMAIPGDASRLRVSADACHGQPYQLRTSESVSEVRVELIATAARAKLSGACSDLVEVRLKKPLAARQLIDVTSGQEVPVGATQASP